jgi:cytochrome c peroxidase
MAAALATSAAPAGRVDAAGDPPVGRDSARSGPRPLPAEAPSPPGNPATAAKVALGKQLFFDRRLSRDGSRSCADCHPPGKAFADGLALATGLSGKPLGRNTPTVLNAGLQEVLLWDGRARTLEEQALLPLESTEEMAKDIRGLVEDLGKIEGYARQFREVFGTEVTADGIAKAIAAFERTVVSGESPFDRFLAGDKKALSDDAEEGRRLFFGEAGCSTCHDGPLLSDGRFHRIGISSADEGRARVTGKKEDRGAFRTPPLREVARTAPYMHDGSLKTLTEVVTFYYRHLPERGPDGEALDARALTGRSFSEVPLIVAFLESLSGKLPDVKKPELP